MQSISKKTKLMWDGLFEIIKLFPLVRVFIGHPVRVYDADEYRTLLDVREVFCK